MLRRLFIASFIVLFVGTGCSSTGNTTDRDANNTTRVTRDAQMAALTEYETFDPGVYPNQAPAVEVDVEHAVPAELMNGTASGGLAGQQRGFRIQLIFARDKSVADQSVSEFLSFWDTRRSERPLSTMFQDTPPIYTVFVQPYYRVRVGDFGTREDADMVLNEIKADFPNAFVMVDIVNQ